MEPAECDPLDPGAAESWRDHDHERGPRDPGVMTKARFRSGQVQQNKTRQFQDRATKRTGQDSVETAKDMFGTKLKF